MQSDQNILDHQSADDLEEARLQSLQNYEILDTAAEQAFDRLTQLASTFYASPIALVSLVDRDRQWFKSRVGLDAEETPRSLAFCHHAIQGDQAFIVNDASKDDRFKDNPLVTGAPDIRFYAGAPLKTPDGHKIGTLCIIDQEPRTDFRQEDSEQLRLLADIVVSEMELRIKNQNLNLAMKEVEKASKSRSDFLSSISHEIRTPLTGVIGLADALADYDIAPEGAEIVEGIQSSSQILMGLLNDVLDYAKLEAGKFQIHRKNVDFPKFIANIQRIWQKIAEEKGLTLKMNLEANLPKVMAMDELRVNQILNNILSNAVKFTKEGEVHVTVSPSRIDGKKAVKIVVTDTGIGMSEQQLANLFSPFEQADASIAQEHGGTGLGMAITQNLVSLLGGQITCESQTGKGTTFTLGFLVRQLNYDHDNTPAATGAVQQTKRILVVDDMDINRMIAKHIIVKMGHVCAEANSGEKAIELLKNGEFDVVVMDLHMPGMDGVQTSAEIKKMKSDQRIISLSADDTIDIRGDQSVLFDGSLIKPLTREKMEEMLRWF
ncbi:response regulator [Sneathiella sp. P13V-1]|uniref:GAF domain-containing hybrid sensor histidine kinase/response regulator n=1 Tax=Sneathiella sp. P13V-1 TaxID=2697366 RepID=UPI00187BB8F2|nr:GAF domain-containing hybrid sensor histidine kinase/response regulator [Sneathiella sp. P13V-1]MBE7636587.1 response regulator [Sneathiella sp. P13V-1]